MRAWGNYRAQNSKWVEKADHRSARNAWADHRLHGQIRSEWQIACAKARLQSGVDRKLLLKALSCL